MDNSNRKSILIISIVALLITSSTLAISIFARGYRFSFKEGLNFKATGILSAISKPKGASVFVNNKLITATDDTINLDPDDYTIKIAKDGYLSWEKNIKIKTETVYLADVQLFRSIPELKPITFTGAINPSVSSDGTKIVYAVASASATKDNGLYIIELNNLLIPINRGTPRLLSSNLPNVDWSEFKFTFSPNSRQILATNKKTNYLISLDTTVTAKNLTDVTSSLPDIEKDWQVQTSQLISSKLEKLPKELQPLISTTSARDIQFSSSEEKVFYLAQNDGDLPEHIISAPPAQSTQTQARNIQKGNYYVYDIIDDTNFLIGSKETVLYPSWLANTNNIIFIENQQIKAVDYDNTNKQTIFTGKFNQNLVYPWPDGNKIIIYTSPYNPTDQNLYTISIK